MEVEPELPVTPAGTKFFKPNLSRPISINPDVINLKRSFSSTTSSSSNSPPEFVRHVQAAFKRQRTIGTMQLNSMKPVRYLVAQREKSEETNTRPAVVQNRKVDVQRDHKPKGSVPESKLVYNSTDNQEHACITPPSEWGASISTQGDNFNPHTPQEVQPGLPSMSGSKEAVARSHLDCGNALAEVQRTVHISVDNLVTSNGVDDRMDSGSDDLLPHMIENKRDVGDQVHTSAVVDQDGPLKDWQHYNCQRNEIENSLMYECGSSSLLARKALSVQDQLHQLGKSVHKDLDNSVTQSSAVGPSCVTSTTRKRGYDPESFFKVNGKLYQRLGKIGSGGSSEVHKVISSDCKIYALKKIKLKGRDIATAFGFCQEIEYLNRLKGKNNIIQLIDYEVTDKTFLREVMNGSMSNKDNNVKKDGYIYMVLEYGEIDMAHMMSRKWKELDGSTITIDDNWLRFYWQQILLSVNTIHEERIVHSDLKPANFLLVRGSLKLIDFGIAKAIMGDTTNIQRDSQVGTVSYMSPEAFMCNGTDANGIMIKYGRPSDIWSLGCILYQMVYGRTPFSKYRTFWAKFKAITDPNHEIIYEPVSNPWLLDLMRKCLAWDRNERWRIPELLKHPFLVPPVPPVPPLPNLFAQSQSRKLLQQITEASLSDQKALDLYYQLQSMLMQPGSVAQHDLATSKDQLCDLLGKISTICSQLQEQLASS